MGRQRNAGRRPMPMAISTRGARDASSWRPIPARALTGVRDRSPAERGIPPPPLAAHLAGLAVGTFHVLDWDPRVRSQRCPGVMTWIATNAEVRETSGISSFAMACLADPALVSVETIVDCTMSESWGN